MTGPRRKPQPPPDTYRLAPVLPIADWHPSTPRASKGRRPPDAEADSRKKRRAPRSDRFAIVPEEVVFDRELELIDLHVWIWLARELHDARGPANLHQCAADVGRTERNIRYAIARLAARGHVRVESRPGRESVYSLPWLAVHNLARRMDPGR